MRREEQRSPFSRLQQELAAKNLELRELGRELEKAIETKEEYRLHSERMKNELIKLKSESTRQKEEEFRANRREIELLREELNGLKREPRPAPPRAQTE